MVDLMPSGRVTAKIFPHPLNAWYAVAWDHEVTSKGLLARTVAAKPFTDHRTRGRGLAIVGMLSNAWTVDRSAGTRVSARLPL